MANNLDSVVASVSILGKEIHFKRLQLFQKFNAHHTCEIEIDYEAFGEIFWMEDPVPFIKYIGEDLNITFKHRESGISNLFLGIITNVSFSGYHGTQNSIIITGSSPTIKMAGKPNMDSFMDLPLQQIVEEAVKNSGNGASIIANPKLKSRLDYICQQEESCWDFLNRLSWLFGEQLFYNGQNCYFGMKYGETVRLEYDKEMTYFDLSANLAPSKTTLRHFLKHASKEIYTETPSDNNLPGVRGYLQVAKNRSESIYTSDVTSPLHVDVNAMNDLNDLAKVEKSRDVGGMLIMRGKTQTCKVKIGDVVNVRLPETMKVTVKSVDRFLVTQVTHIIDQDGRYSNSFEAIIDGIEVIPMEEPKIPVAMPQIATVKENVDRYGRGLVKVQTEWQRLKNKTSNWIRVQTPDAGTSDKVPMNRGFVHIPEIGDVVMLGFEYGDPSRPFVSGSIFLEKISKGGGVNNNIKTITTRSGHTIELNDNEKNDWGITIKDKNNNVIYLDTQGQNIEITAPETITLNAKNININAGENISMVSGTNTDIQAGNNLIESAGNEYQLTAGKSISSIEKESILNAKKIQETAEKVTLNSTKEDMDLASTKKVNVQSSDKVNLF